MILEREDLIARTAAFIGVIAALLSLPHWFEANFEARIPSSFSSLKLTIAREDEQILKHAQQGPLIKPSAQQQSGSGESFIANKSNPLVDKSKLEVDAPPGEAIKEQAAPRDTGQIKMPGPKSDSQKEAMQSKPDPASEGQKAQITDKAQEKARPAQPSKPAQRKSAPASSKEIQNDKASTATYASSGSSSQSSNAKAAQNAGADNLAALQSRLLSLIRSKTNYPRTAIRRKMQGEVLIEFKLQDGTLTDFVLVQGSGYKLLDEAALKLAKSLQGTLLLKAPGEISLRVPIIYRLL